MRVCIFGIAALAAVAATPTQAGPDSVALLCAEPQLVQQASRLPIETDLPGTYQCSEEGITITLHLDASGRFNQRMQTDEPVLTGDDGNAATDTHLSGRWRVENRTLHLFEKPARPPSIELVEAKNDPSVDLRVEVRTADGAPARNLFIGEGEYFDNRRALEDGLLLIPKDREREPGKYWIVRLGDELGLTAFDTGPNRPNSFRYIYRSSEVEPFDQRADIVGEMNETIVVPLGIGCAILRRIKFPFLQNYP